MLKVAKKGSCFLFILCFCFGFIQDENDPHLLLGRVNVQWLQSSARYKWFDLEYNNYSTQVSAIEQLSKITPETSFLIFSSTWDADCQRILPQFFKVLDVAKIPRGRAILYFLDRDKKSPQGFEGEHFVTALPTFIVLKNGQEVGRISGNITTSIESELVDIILR